MKEDQDFRGYYKISKTFNELNNNLFNYINKMSLSKKLNLNRRTIINHIELLKTWGVFRCSSMDPAFVEDEYVKIKTDMSMAVKCVKERGITCMKDCDNLNCCLNKRHKNGCKKV